MKEVTINSDGGSFGNPGPGGYGVVLKYKNHRKELSGGFRKTTNNRMEILGVIRGLQELTEPCNVKIFTDSRYVVNTISKGWALKWRANNWVKSNKEVAANSDLWAILLELCDKHKVTMNWVKGHAGDIENERCDVLCKIAGKRSNLPEDKGYENSLESNKKQLV